MQLSLDSVPKAYIGLLDAQRPTLDVQGDRAWPDMKLDPAVVLDGVVVDGAGKLVAGAEVHVLPPDSRGFFSSPPPARTGPDGAFRFEQIDPDDTLPVWARTREATTDGMIAIRPRDLKGKLTLTIEPKFAFRIRGRVTDRSGKRLAGAKAVVWWYRSYKSEKLGRPMGLGSTFDAQTLDNSGWFVFRGLWPGDRYKVVIEAPGYGKAEPPEVQGKAGETQDLGTIALAGAGGHIAGRVVGSDGRPIAGATVFNRGDAPQPVTVRTDASGRFRLEGLFPDSKYAFVRKEGYRLTGAKVDGDADDLAITMLRTDEPPPTWKPGAAPTLEDQRAFARKVLVRLWETFGEKADQNGASACIPAMARIDLELALQWSAERGHRFDAQARQAAAEELAETDGPGALELLALVDGISKQYALQRLAERFAEADPKKAGMFIDEAIVQARSLLQPARTCTLAQAGEVLVRLGRAEAGRKLIDEAAADAARLGTAGMEGYARGIVARALAPFDVDRALTLVAPFRDPNEKDRYTGFVAEGIAAIHPDRAVALADAMSQRSTLPDLVKTGIANRIGSQDPDRAVRIVEGMKSYAADKMRAEAFAWLAVAVAPHDRARAIVLIDRALALPIDRPDVYRSWIHFGGAMAPAATMAACARHAGYPDMDGVIMRVMATRTGLGERDAHDPALEVRSATMAAVPLTLVDPGAARVLLGQIEARGGLDPVKLAEVAGDDWLRAWGLVDLEKAEAFVDAQLAELEKTGAASLRGSPIFKMLDTLIEPPDRREAEVFHVIGPSWRPAFQY
jgi:protocatechuate 3,4-dioxygenase beta subunit